MFTIQTLENSTLAEIAGCFNAAFADYLVPIHVDEAKLTTKFRQENILPEWSAGVIHKGQLVGFILNGYRVVDGRGVLYNGGTGVIPEYRGQKLTGKMYAFLKERGEAAGIRHFVLEFIKGNDRARKVYENIGFSVSREFNLYKGGRPEEAVSQTTITIQQIKQANWAAWDNWREMVPCWSGANESVDALGDEAFVAVAMAGTETIGYIALNRPTARLLQLAVAPAFRRQKVATRLLQFAFDAINADQMLVLNVDAGTESLNAFFHAIGWPVALQQFEMVMQG
ncbi:GNAT family N-acetyltransferase [Flavihumibacter rivuli]|uniref:GNAT family N-acetyltransferase n=1 Tax=Flavihumibacter rivuli TaxID=2838156 RepID=UPI001BDEC31A|nr:GNAT family N-acetyltransferase [Flavihumibacter rivuli]ULQ55190.1 GNAT family N-acetyltransferase [Flavihumibacter rivuli]